MTTVSIGKYKSNRIADKSVSILFVRGIPIHIHGEAQQRMIIIIYFTSTGYSVLFSFDFPFSSRFLEKIGEITFSQELSSLNHLFV